MKDVARIAGVSTMTVSRALRDKTSVSQGVLARIREVVDSVGYVPNRVAGSLSSSRTTLVALILPNLRNAMHAELIQGISDVLRPQDFQLMISDCGNSLELEEQLIGTYIAQQVCGVILHNTAHTDKAVRALRNAGIPCVETGNFTAHPIDMTVSYSNFAAGKAVAEHFVSLGYDRVGCISLPIRNRDRIKASRKGFIAGLRKAGRPVEPGLLVEIGPGLENGGRALRRILEAVPDTRAVFCTGDVLAAGALFECQRRGIRVPSQMAIAASDDSDLLQNTVPTVTTVKYPRYRIGVRAAELIVARATRAVAGNPKEDLGFEIVRRGST